MKKIMIMFAAVLTISACNGTSESNTAVDSLAVDSSAVLATDSTVAKIPADSVSVAK